MLMEIIDYSRGKLYISSKGTFIKLGLMLKATILQMSEDIYIVEITEFPMQTIKLEEFNSFEEAKRAIGRWFPYTEVKQKLSVLKINSFEETDSNEPYSKIVDVSGNPVFNLVKAELKKPEESFFPTFLSSTVPGTLSCDKPNYSFVKDDLPEDYEKIVDFESLTGRLERSE